MDDSSNIQQSEQTIEQNEIIQNKTNEQNNKYQQIIPHLHLMPKPLKFKIRKIQIQKHQIY